MGVISNGSVVGVVSSVSDHFSVVLPILNPKFQESVKMKGSGDFGLIAWPPGSDPAYADVKDIPKHVQVSIGDTVLTTGYGSHFPSDLFIGYVSELNDQPEENFHRIKIQLATDFRKLSHVQVVSDILKQEQDSLLIQQQQRDGVEDNN
jgi:rod shape-determining protein MreC